MNQNEGLEKIAALVKEYGIKTYSDEEFYEVVKTKTASGISAGEVERLSTGHNRATSETEKKGNTMEALKALLGEELFAQVEGKLAGKKLMFEDANLIPKHRLDEVIAQRDGFKAQVEKADKDLKALQTSAKGNEELTAQIEGLREANKQAKAEAEANQLRIQKSFALKEGLMNAGVIDSEARDLLALKFGEVELNQDGTVKKFADLLKPIKENKAFAGMFGEVKRAGQEHGEGGSPTLLNKLEQALADAQKSGNTAAIVSAKQALFESQKSKAA